MSIRSELQLVINDLNSILALPGTHDTFALPEIYNNLVTSLESLQDLSDEVELNSNDITDLETNLGNESTARVNADDNFGNLLDLLSQRIDNLLFDPIPPTSSMDGKRINVFEFFEILSEDQIDGLTQRLALFTNALNGKLSDVSASTGTGLTIDKSNPSFPVITLNKPFWANIQSKPSSFPSSIIEVSGLVTALSDKADLVAGKIPSSQLPSYVDDVLEFANLASFPGTGETSKIYIAIDTNYSYRWTGSIYSLIVSSPGTTDSVTEGTTNKYFTEARVRATIATGLTDTSGTMSASDSILTLFGKIKKFISDFSYNVLNQVLTGLSLASGGVISSSDSILTALGKLQYQISNFATSDGFEVGDIKDTMRDQTSGRWLYLRGNTIGDDSSNATEFANNQANELFFFLWDNFPALTVRNSSGTIVTRGASAIADWTAHRTIQLFDFRGRFRRHRGASGNGTKANGSAFDGGNIGDYGNDKFQGHWHDFQNKDGQNGVDANWGTAGPDRSIQSDRVKNPVSDGTNGTPRTGDETNPAYISVNSWIRY